MKTLVKRYSRLIAKILAVVILINVIAESSNAVPVWQLHPPNLVQIRNIIILTAAIPGQRKMERYIIKNAYRNQKQLISSSRPL